MKKHTKILIALLTLLLLFSSIGSAVEPRWINTRRVFIYHDKIDGNAHLGIQITGVSGISHINNIDITFERYLGNNAWEEIASWTDLSTTDSIFNFNEEIPNIPSGYTYRLHMTADVYKDGVCESLDEDYEDTY